MREKENTEEKCEKSCSGVHFFVCSQRNWVIGIKETIMYLQGWFVRLQYTDHGATLKKKMIISSKSIYTYILFAYESCQFLLLCLPPRKR